MDSWGFTFLAIAFSATIYTDRVQYFKKDKQLMKHNNLLKKYSEIDALIDIFNRRKLNGTMGSE
ncbi:MAG: hypothetical protein J7L77_07740 [Clostridiales bacterium]|nr:hypothetical protein [Clostridiales bacterium]